MHITKKHTKLAYFDACGTVFCETFKFCPKYPIFYKIITIVMLFLFDSFFGYNVCNGIDFKSYLLNLLSFLFVELLKLIKIFDLCFGLNIEIIKLNVIFFNPNFVFIINIWNFPRFSNNIISEYLFYFHLIIRNILG